MFLCDFFEHALLLKNKMEKLESFWKTAVADLRSKILDAPTRSKFFQFNAVFWKIWQNHMFAPPGVLAPLPRGKSWICHWTVFSIMSLDLQTLQQKKNNHCKPFTTEIKQTGFYFSPVINPKVPIESMGQSQLSLGQFNQIRLVTCHYTNRKTKVAM